MSCGSIDVNQIPFTPTGQTQFAVGTTSVSIALPTNGSSSPAATKVVVTNVGENEIFVLLGDSSVVATEENGFIILPNTSFVLAINANLYLAAIANNSTPESGVYISTGY